jgi:hypothetical protein
MASLFRHAICASLGDRSVGDGAIAALAFYGRVCDIAALGDIASNGF